MSVRNVQSLVAVVAVACAMVAGGAMLAAQAKVDLTGKWAMEVTTEAGTTTPTVTLKQDGEKLTGHYSSETLGEADVTGTVKGQDVTISFTADLQGQAVPVAYAAKLESANMMKGTISIPGVAEGTFSAKKE